MCESDVFDDATRESDTSLIYTKAIHRHRERELDMFQLPGRTLPAPADSMRYVGELLRGLSSLLFDPRPLDNATFCAIDVEATNCGRDDGRCYGTFVRAWFIPFSPF